MKTFGARLEHSVAKHGPVCVGIDPHAALLEQWGLSVDPDGLERFSEICVEAFAGYAAIVKPQVAFFEVFGVDGYEVLQNSITTLRDAGTLVLADAKRGDIGSTMQAYADAWLGDGPLSSDAMTVSPYLGYGALSPALSLAPKRGVFVLSATSNPEAKDLQAGIRQSIVDAAAATNREQAQDHPGLGSVGVVVGATLESVPDLSALNGPILMPGVGAQGAGPEQVRSLTNGLRGVLPSASRDVLKFGPDIGALRGALAALNDDFAFLV